MTTSAIKTADASNTEHVLSLLGRHPVQNAWAIQDLSRFAGASKLHFVEDGGSLTYLLISGHPSTRRGAPTIILGGRPEAAAPLITAHLPATPWIMRETPSTFAPLVQKAAPQAVVSRMRRMEVTRESFKPTAARYPTRKLVEDDATSLAEFFGDTSGSAHGYKYWLRDGYVFGAFDGDKLGAIATAIVQSAEAWVLVGIETRKDLRGKGLGSAVTAAMTAAGLERVKTVSLTVATDNAPALAVYRKLGFLEREERLWVDNGTGVAP